MQTAQRKSLIMLRWMMVASLALPVALFLVAAYVSYGSTCEEADRDIRRSLDVVHEHAEKVFETIDRSLSEIDEIVRDLSDAEIKAREQALHGRLRQLSDTLPQMKSAWVFDVQGRPLVSSMIYPAPDMIFADR
ncbi:MAG: hybrid sensor histidine kinase/response regulator, partial [Bradyrhizobium sp.]|nr:hybrid sensor histidine kinase/response regulator [Bradyrhizobium sp.]